MLKVGDKVREGDRVGCVTAIHTKGTADVLFPNMKYAIRRQERNLRKVNPSRRSSMYTKRRKSYRRIPRRRNVAPSGVTKTQLADIFTTPWDEHPMDKYISDLPTSASFADYRKVGGSKAKIPRTYLIPSLNPRTLFGTSAKTLKSNGKTAEVRVLYLAPHKLFKTKMPGTGYKDSRYPINLYNDVKAQNSDLVPSQSGDQFRFKGFRKNPISNYCIFATEGCAQACLFQSGHLGNESGTHSAWQKSWYLQMFPLQFFRQLLLEIQRDGVKSQKDGMDYYVRLNGTSDIPWEKYIDIDKVVKDFTGVKGFYDYTKWPYKARMAESRKKGFPKNYDITFSLSEREQFAPSGKAIYSSSQLAQDWLMNGGRVAVVVEEFNRWPKGRAPKGYEGKRGDYTYKIKTAKGMEPRYLAIADYTDLKNYAINAKKAANRGKYPHIVDGDETDFRFLDPSRSIVILKPKGIFVDKKGNIFVGKDAQTKKNKILTAQEAQFLKSRDWVLNLQDKIAGKTIKRQPFLQTFVPKTSKLTKKVRKKAPSKAKSTTKKATTAKKKTTPKKATTAKRVITTSQGRKMYYVGGRLVSKARYDAAKNPRRSSKSRPTYAKAVQKGRTWYIMANRQMVQIGATSKWSSKSALSRSLARHGYALNEQNKVIKRHAREK